jgi:hypothetical protein
MAVRVTLSLDDELAAELQKVASQTGRSLEEVLTTSVRASIATPRPPAASKPFEVRAKALHARPGFNFDNIEELLEQAEGPTHR